jgi:hypothetical protein
MDFSSYAFVARMHGSNSTNRVTNDALCNTTNEHSSQAGSIMFRGLLSQRQLVFELPGFLPPDGLSGVLVSRLNPEVSP